MNKPQSLWCSHASSNLYQIRLNDVCEHPESDLRLKAFRNTPRLKSDCVVCPCFAKQHAERSSYVSLIQVLKTHRIVSEFYSLLIRPQNIFGK